MKNKNITYLNALLLVLMLHIVSCDDDTKEYIMLKTNSIKMCMEQEYSIEILSKNTALSVTSEDEQIASAIIKNKTVVITAKEKTGETILHIKDSFNNEETITVQVSTLFGTWIATEFSQYKINVIIEAEDETIKEDLEQLLWEPAARLLSTNYGFNANSKTLEVRKPNGETLYGEFEFGNGKLIMKYDNNIESYGVVFLTQSIIQLTQDLTDSCKNKYPQAGINKAVIISHIVKKIYY